ncbi:MAG: tRNA threonylcarbamoyladenosine dehydratase [Clostridia bacterium]|nr:tRNA threonylcarbamoyladenosine dehydratase [Clostridia bacterium]
MTNERFIRTELLLGAEAMCRLSRAKVIVFGAGGVGGAAIEALARGGVGEIHVVDPDSLSESNINRQILAVEDTVGKNKAEAAVERIKSINPRCVAIPHRHFYLPDDKGGIVLSDFDYVIDAIDTVSAKLALIEEAYLSRVPIISSMGTGNKLDPTRLTVSDISKTNTCPLAAVIRRECRKRGIGKLKVVWSDETPLKVLAEQSHGRHAPGSISFVPPVAGYIIGGEVIKELAGINASV